MGVDSRKKLIDISYELFREKDAQEIHVRDIAAQAGVTTGSFYHHFKNKYAVLSAKKDEDEFVIASFDTTNFQVAALEQLKIFLVEFMGDIILRDGIRITRIIYMTSELSRRESSAMVQIVETLIQTAAERGEIREGVDASWFVKQLLKGFRGTIFSWCRENGVNNLKTMLADTMEIYICYARA